MDKLFIPVFLTAFLILSHALAETSAPIKRLEDGRIEMGEVTIDPQKRSLTFPATVNMQTGMVEYVVVTSTGKTHESVLRTEAKPFHIHTAMLLLGAKGGRDPAAFLDPKKELPGEQIQIFAAWQDQRRPLQELVAHATNSRPMTLPHWIYNGSYASDDGRFLAQVEGSIVSLISDRGALINNPRQDRDNDELWTVNTNTVPEVGTPVQVIIELPVPPSK